MEVVIDLIEKAKKRGLNINFDVYPYNVSWSVLYPYLPKSAVEGGREKLLKRLEDKTEKKKVISEMRKADVDYGALVIAYALLNKSFTLYAKSYVGRSVGEIAKEKGVSVEEAVCDVLLGNRGHVICFDERLSEDNLKLIMAHPLSIISSSGAGYDVEYSREGQLVHPRCFGAFPRFLGKYVRDQKLVSWEKAVNKITGAPAEKLKLKDRGWLKKGKKADIVIFDPGAVIDRATFDNPYQYPEGIKHVIINGSVVVEQGQQDRDVLAGEVLRGG
jgi:N-acyl-D-aspartate/D-glutamate deacylase